MLACHNIGSQAGELHIETGNQSVDEIAVLLRGNMCKYGTFGRWIRGMWGLFCWLRYTYINFQVFTGYKELNRLRDIQRNI